MAHFIDVIKYEGDNNTFIWKHPREDFNNLSQLVVHESQEAVFFMNGQVMDIFEPGHYTLNTKNLPILSKMLKLVTGGNSPFHCEVYFINKTVQMGIKWGTPELIRFIEPTYNIPVAIGAAGEMNFAVKDSEKLLINLVGTTNGIAWDDKDNSFSKSLKESFRALIVTAVKTHLSSSIKTKNINLLEIDEHLEELQEVLKEKILPGFEEYGLTICQFYLSTINLPEGDANFKKLRELHTINLQTKMAEAEATVKSAYAEADASVIAARRKAVLEEQTTETEIAKRAAERELIDAQTKAQAAKIAGFAEAEVMKAKGYTQKDVFNVDVQKAYAEGLGNMASSGGSGVLGDIVGLSAGFAAAEKMGSKFNGMINDISDNDNKTIECPSCGKSIPSNSKFCLECGSKIEILLDNEIICPSCGNKTLKGKFCSSCGASLIRKCPKCNSEVSPESKFCLECGKKL